VKDFPALARLTGLSAGYLRWLSEQSTDPTLRPGLGDAAHIVTGVVEHGDRRGRELGFPTANLRLSEESRSGGPGDGVWAGLVQIDPHNDGPVHPAVISIGRRPTFYRRGERLLEAHLLDFTGDLYDHHIAVHLHELQRLQKRFGDTAELVAQIEADRRTTAHWYARHCGLDPQSRARRRS